MSDTTSVRYPPLATLFMLAFVAGSAAIFLCEWLPLPGALARGGALLVPLAVMGAYFGIARATVRASAKNTMEQVADSLYYLGFMFTIVALVSTLMGLVVVDSATIVSRFGFALVTTLAGLLGKVMLTQFSADAAQKQRYVEDGLRQAAVRFKAQLDSSSTQLEDYVLNVHSRIDKSVDAMLESIDLTTREHLDGLTQLGVAHLDTLAAASADTASKVGATQQAFVERTQGLERQLAEASEALTEQARERHERLAERASGLVSDLEGRAAALGETFGALGGELDEVVRRQRAFSATLIEERRSTQRQLRESARLIAMVDRVEALCSEGVSTLEGLGTSQSSHADQLSDLVRSVKGEIVEGVQQLEHARAASEEQRLKRLSALATDVGERIDRLEGGLAERSRTLEGHLTTIGESLERKIDVPPTEPPPARDDGARARLFPWGRTVSPASNEPLERNESRRDHGT